MVAPGTEIRIPNLTKLDKHELQEYLGQSVTFEAEELTAEKTGEPVTIAAIVILSAVAIKAISLWLMKRRTKAGITFTFQEKQPNGAERTKTVEIAFSSSSPPAAEVVQKIGEVFGADDNLIAEALKLTSAGAKG